MAQLDAAFAALDRRAPAEAALQQAQSLGAGYVSFRLVRLRNGMLINTAKNITVRVSNTVIRM